MCLTADHAAATYSVALHTHARWVYAPPTGPQKGTPRQDLLWQSLELLVQSEAEAGKDSEPQSEGSAEPKAPPAEPAEPLEQPAGSDGGGEPDDVIKSAVSYHALADQLSATSSRSGTCSSTFPNRNCPGPQEQP